MEETSGDFSKRRSVHQDTIFLNFMQKYPQLANCTYRNRALVSTLWASLTEMLNTNGPVRNVYQWRKAWADWKNYVRKKVQENKLPLSPAEEIIAKICGFGDLTNRNRICGYDEPLQEGDENEEDTKPTLLISKVTKRMRDGSPTRSRSPSRSSSPAISNDSSESRRTTRLSSSPARSNTKSSTPRSSLSRRNSSLSTKSGSTKRSISHTHDQFEEVPCSSASLSGTRYSIVPDMLLPEEDPAISLNGDCCDNNLTNQFKKQLIALNAVVENLNRNINTQRDVLKTAKALNNEFKNLNKNINRLTESMKNKSDDDRVHNRQIELLQMKRNLLTRQLISIEEEQNICNKIVNKKEC